MQAIDRTAIETLGIPRLLLMDHAGLAVAREAHRLASIRGGPIVILCGTGYNGGDGLSAARHLHNWGRLVRVLLAGGIADLREEPATYARIATRLGIAVRECPTVGDVRRRVSWWSGCGVLIDALLGIGLRGPVREPIRSLITAINASGKTVVAADIASGLDGDTGVVHGVAVRAHVTVTFGLPKRGCLVGEGPRYTGRLVVDPITFPQRLLQANG